MFSLSFSSDTGLLLWEPEQVVTQEPDYSFSNRDRGIPTELQQAHIGSLILQPFSSGRCLNISCLERGQSGFSVCLDVFFALFFFSSHKISPKLKPLLSCVVSIMWHTEELNQLRQLLLGSLGLSIWTRTIIKGLHCPRRTKKNRKGRNV